MHHQSWVSWPWLGRTSGVFSNWCAGYDRHVTLLPDRVSPAGLRAAVGHRSGPLGFLGWSSTVGDWGRSTGQCSRRAKRGTSPSSLVTEPVRVDPPPACTLLLGVGQGLPIVGGWLSTMGDRCLSTGLHSRPAYAWYVSKLPGCKFHWQSHPGVPPGRLIEH